ncbi:hypothetical protein CE91St19_08800 [Odoribacter laneus]|jgi:hypothetical protein|nr:hypothetical protein CE91St19_08800 [Odoribacter laneus]GKI26060.1 hypothetical protein CE91St20_21970 [Odoribacter laneus]
MPIALYKIASKDKAKPYKRPKNVHKVKKKGINKFLKYILPDLNSAISGSF